MLPPPGRRRPSPARSDRFDGFRRVALTVCSAGLVVLAFPPHSLRALIWVALVPLFSALRTVSARRAAVLGATWGMLGAYGVTDWLPPTVASYYLQPLWLGATLFVSAAFAMGGVYYALFGVIYAKLADSRLRPVSLLAAAVWVAAEFGRARVLTGNPWGLLGYTLPGSVAGNATFDALNQSPTSILQLASLAGVYGLSFLIVAVNAALAELWAWVRGNRNGTGAFAEVVVVACLAAASHTYGRVRMNDDGPVTRSETPIAIVQGNLDLGSQWNESLYGRNLAEYLRLTNRAIEEGAPRIVFWPENAMTFFVDDEPIYRSVIASVTAAGNAELVAGAPRFEQRSQVSYFNSAFLLSPQGEILAHYDKEQLLPFAEYFPFGSISYLQREFARVREFSAGTGAPPLATRAGAAGVVICNEAMFPRIVRRRVRAGADYLVNLSNDTWVQDVEFALHQFALVSLRAVENARYMVRASTSGPSAIIDPFGRVVARTAPFTDGYLLGSIRPLSATTPYTRFGDVFAWACVALTGIAVLGTRLRRLTPGAGV